jgi:hypothetical protein
VIGCGQDAFSLGKPDGFSAIAAQARKGSLMHKTLGLNRAPGALGPKLPFSCAVPSLGGAPSGSPSRISSFGQSPKPRQTSCYYAHFLSISPIFYSLSSALSPANSYFVLTGLRQTVELSSCHVFWLLGPPCYDVSSQANLVWLPNLSSPMPPRARIRESPGCPTEMFVAPVVWRCHFSDGTKQGLVTHAQSAFMSNIHSWLTFDSKRQRHPLCGNF